MPAARRPAGLPALLAPAPAPATAPRFHHMKGFTPPAPPPRYYLDALRPSLPY